MKSVWTWGIPPSQATVGGKLFHRNPPQTLSEPFAAFAGFALNAGALGEEDMVVVSEIDGDIAEGPVWIRLDPESLTYPLCERMQPVNLIFSIRCVILL